MRCHWMIKRKDLTEMIEEINPDWSAEATEIAPDGDVFIPDDLVERFRVPICKSCGGDLKPDVVFFGDNVKKPIVDYCMVKVDESDSLLVLGSSLQVKQENITSYDDFLVNEAFQYSGVLWLSFH